MTKALRVASYASMLEDLKTAYANWIASGCPDEVTHNGRTVRYSHESFRTGIADLEALVARDAGGAPLKQYGVRFRPPS